MFRPMGNLQKQCMEEKLQEAFFFFFFKCAYTDQRRQQPELSHPEWMLSP